LVGTEIVAPALLVVSSDDFYARRREGMPRFKKAALVGCFLSAIAGPAGGWAREVFEVLLIPCNEALCGVSSETVFREGKVEVCDKGEVKVLLRGGPKDEGLCLEFQSWGSQERELVGDFRTDEEGDAEAEVGVLDVRGEMGLFLVTDCGESPLLVTGIVTHPGDSGDDDEGEEEDDGDHGGGGGEVEDPDDDGVPNGEDPDDDGDGISDLEDAHPDHPNYFDDVRAFDELRDAYRDRKRALKNEHGLALRELKEEQREEKKALADDYRERKGELR